MAVTSTLSRLKNYFIGWHTANYDTLHYLTDTITDDENDPNSKYAVRSRAIKQILDGLNNSITTITGDLGTPCNNLPDRGKDSTGNHTVWSNICSIWNGIGTECEETTVYVGSATNDKYSKGKTLWNNICHIWGNLGKWGDDDLYTSSYGNPRTIWGWITQFSKKIPILEEKTKYANVSYSTVDPYPVTGITEGIISREYMDKYLSIEKIPIDISTQHFFGKITLYRRGAWGLCDINLDAFNLNAEYTYHVGISNHMTQAQINRFKPLADTWGSHSKYVNFQLLHDAHDNGGEPYQILLRIYPTESFGMSKAAYGSVIYPIELQTWTQR